MNEELIEEILSNGFDVYEALENYNLEIIDNEITGNEEEIEMFLREMISEVGINLTKEFISGQEEVEEILEDMLQAENERYNGTLDEYYDEEAQIFEYYDEEKTKIDEEEIAEEQVKIIQEENKIKIEEIRKMIASQIRNFYDLTIDSILTLSGYDLKMVNGKIVSGNDSFVLLDEKEVAENLKEARLKEFKERFEKEEDYSSRDFLEFYLKNYFTLNTRLSDEQRMNISKHISKRELADNLYVYIEDLNHLKIDSLEEQEQINAIKAAVYVIYCVLEVSSDSWVVFYDYSKLEKIHEIYDIISISEKFIHQKLDEYSDDESKKYLYDEYFKILSDSYEVIDKQIECGQFCGLCNEQLEYLETMGFTSNEIFALVAEYGIKLDGKMPNSAVVYRSYGYRSYGNKFEFLADLISTYKIVPEFFKRDYPEMVLADETPDELKNIFYAFSSSKAKKLTEHPEWEKLLEGKIPPGKYIDLVNVFGSDILSITKVCIKNPISIEEIVQYHKELTLKKWYDAVGGKFIPHHVVMLNFPEEEIDSFLANSKKWSRLMQLKGYGIDDSEKTAILKAAYTMGVFEGDDVGFNRTIKLFTDVPQELSEEEYNKVEVMLHAAYYLIVGWDEGSLIESPHSGRWEENEESLIEFPHLDRWEENKERDRLEAEHRLELFKQAYILNNNGRYVFSMDKQKNKDKVREIRQILEDAEIPRILTPQKAHTIFDSFAMVYNPDFAKFFNENIEEILSNPEYTKDISTIQRQFKDIVRTNSGRKITLDVAEDYIRSIEYTDIEVGNEEVAKQAKIAGYSQADFEIIQDLFNEGETREFSSIPRIQGRTNGYTYEILRLDDPLALTIGTLTDCCQEIYGAGETSMQHSVVSPDGRVFCVKDEEGRIVAQSWVWRNQNTVCFDNIEIPERIFELYRKEHQDVETRGLATDVLEVYKRAAQDLMKEDARVYQELLEKGTITQEQYDALLLGKVTIGLGYNDIANAIKADKTLRKETDGFEVIRTDRFPYLYTDAKTQYIIAERERKTKSTHANLYVHQDDVPVFDGTNMTKEIFLTMEKMGLELDTYYSEDVTESQEIIDNIAQKYDLVPEYTKVIATRRIALIYSKNENEIKIADLLSSPIRNDITDKQKQIAETHVRNQIKKALEQIGVGKKDTKIDLSLLNDEQMDMIQSIIEEIEKTNEERGEK